MSDKISASIQSLLRFSLPLGATVVAGNPDTQVTWSVTIRAQPPAFPDIYGGELALVSMDVLRSFDSRLRLADVIRLLADVGVQAVLATGEVCQKAIDEANECGTVLVSVPLDSSLTTIERAVNALLLNQAARLTERAMEIQRQLTRLAAENRDLGSLLQVMARATGKPIVVHDETGVMITHINPQIGRRSPNGRNLLHALPHAEFHDWLRGSAPRHQGAITKSPMGYSTILQVEKQIAGYLSLVDREGELDEFDRLVLVYGADVCTIEIAKHRAIASAVEQTRGDWIQMWLSGTPADEDLLRTRAQQSGFDPSARYALALFRPIAESGQAAPISTLMSLVRDDLSRRSLNGAVGQYVDVIVALYPLGVDESASVARARALVEEQRGQMAARFASGTVAAGISRPATGLSALREAYREAKDAVGIASELNDQDSTTFYGDLKLYQLLLALKERNLDKLHQFYVDALGPLVEHDNRKHSDLIRTLAGFFEANGNLARAAQELDVHRNTLVYRLERIAELTELDLDDSDNRLILHLALKTKRVLATIPSEMAGV